MSDVETKVLPLLPLTTGVVLPQMVVPLALESDEARSAADAARSHDDLVVLVPRFETETGWRYAKVGTVAKIQEAGRLPSGSRAILVRGLHRAVLGVGEPLDGGSGLQVAVERVTDHTDGTERERALATEYRVVVEAILEHRQAIGLAEALKGITVPGTMADTAGYSPDLSFEQKVELLEAVDVEARLEKVVRWARETLAELELKQRIRSDVSEGMEKRQREFLLRQQMESIRKELGDTDGDVASDYRAKAEEKALPDNVAEFVTREIDRLERMGEQSPEHSWIRTWLDRVLDLPWGERSADRLELGEARSILDADHEGLDDVKERIVEHLAVRKLRSARGLGGSGGVPRKHRGSGGVPRKHRGSGGVPRKHR